ncbi:uncharacterized [Tachysurus ichikawai]
MHLLASAKTSPTDEQLNIPNDTLLRKSLHLPEDIALALCLTMVVGADYLPCGCCSPSDLAVIITPPLAPVWTSLFPGF